MDVDLYLRLRAKEGRLYPDAIVARLPQISVGHPLADEWRARSASAARLTRYLSRRPGRLTILDLGTGNGWFGHVLSRSGHRVIGLDGNQHELQQAARVFTGINGLNFVEGDVFSAPFTPEAFDVVLLASVIQYFYDLPLLLRSLARHLKPGGEIHVMDSPLYSETEWPEAAQRSRQYFASLGFPEMSNYYHHHRLSELNAFDPIILYRPVPLRLRLKRLLGRMDSPFSWIVLKREYVK